MSSQLGYLPKEISTLANGLQVQTDKSVVYNAPIGFHLVSTLTGATELSARQVVGGLILLDAGGAPLATDLPSAEELVDALNGAQVGMSVRFIVKNTGGETITFSPAQTGITNFSGNTVALLTADSAEYVYVLTNVDAGEEAATFFTISSANTQ